MKSSPLFAILTLRINVYPEWDIVSFYTYGFTIDLNKLQNTLKIEIFIVQ